MVADWDGSRDKAYRVVVETLLRERDRDTARAVMEAFMEARPDERAALLAHATFAIRAERLDEARGILARLLESNPDDAEALLLQTRVLRSQGRVEEALETLDRLAELEPDDLDVRVTRARLLVGARRYDDALEAFRSLAEQAPRNADVRYALALLLLQTNRLDEAAEQLHILVEQRQRRQVAHYYLGQIAEARGNPVEALAHYAEVEEGEHFVDAQVRTASLLAERGDLEAARAHLHGVAVDTTAEDVRLYLVESELLADAGRYEDALEILGQGITEHPESNDLLYARAMMAEKLDRLELLEEDLRTILERDPDNAQALNALGYTLADRTERYEEAHALIEKALELRPDDYYILDSMGWVLYRLGRLEEALEYLRRAAALSDDVEVAAHLGEVLWVMGERQEAREVWNSALEHTPGDPRLLDVMDRLMP
jgi:tetratricopeptide (TPR) repeat protein